MSRNREDDKWSYLLRWAVASDSKPGESSVKPLLEDEFEKAHPGLIGDFLQGMKMDADAWQDKLAAEVSASEKSQEHCR